MPHWIDTIVFPEFWHDLRGTSVDDTARRQRLTSELRRELSAAHPLMGREWLVSAVASGRDDVVLRLAGDEVAIVHLTYTRTPPDAPWPSTVIVTSADALEQEFLRRA